MVDGPLKGLSARAVFVVDQNNKIRYVELTPDITLEPNYDLAMAAVDKLM
jgi:thiol peroxidase